MIHTINISVKTKLPRPPFMLILLCTTSPFRALYKINLVILERKRNAFGILKEQYVVIINICKW